MNIRYLHNDLGKYPLISSSGLLTTWGRGEGGGLNAPWKERGMMKLKPHSWSSSGLISCGALSLLGASAWAFLSFLARSPRGILIR